MAEKWSRVESIKRAIQNAYESGLEEGIRNKSTELSLREQARLSSRYVDRNLKPLSPIANANAN